MEPDADTVPRLDGGADDIDDLEPEEIARRLEIQKYLDELDAITTYMRPVKSLERRRVELYMVLRDEYGVANTVIAAHTDATPEAVRVAVSKERARVRDAAAEAARARRLETARDRRQAARLAADEALQGEAQPGSTT